MRRRYDNAGRPTCGDKKSLLMALLLMPYALLRYGIDRVGGRG